MGEIRYDIQIEVVEGEQCAMHRVGQVFNYPDDVGKLCPWLLDSVNGMARVLLFGGVLPWKYAGTIYSKEANDSEVATEFVRCPDPTSQGVVVKITRRLLRAPKEVGWA